VTICGAVPPIVVTPAARDGHHRRASAAPIPAPPGDPAVAAAHARAGNALRHEPCDESRAGGVSNSMRSLTTAWMTLALAAGVPTISTATPITPGAFGAFAIVESFEGLTPGANLALGLGQSLLEPGTVSAFVFGSGVQLSSPVPNPGFANSGPFVHDLALGTDVQNNWGGSRVVNDAGDVPFGSAYLGAFHPGTGTVSVAFEFDTLQQRVGAYVTGVTGMDVQLAVYGDGATLLETLTLGTVDLNGWPANFLGLEQLTGIRTVVFSGRDFGIDGLTFEASPLVVPEPGTLSAFALGLFGLVGLAMLGNRKSTPELAPVPLASTAGPAEPLQT
jgi:hypothetical protein